MICLNVPITNKKHRTDYYERNFSRCHQQTVSIDPASFLSPLADCLAPGATVLRDTKERKVTRMPTDELRQAGEERGGKDPMKYDPAIYRRRSIRLKGYDYSRNGAYFITLCTQDRRCFLGRVVDGEMRLNDAGIMAFQWYRELENKFSDIKCDTFVCMPNHVHFVVVNVSDNAIGGGHTGPEKQGGHTGPRKQGGHTGPPLPRVVQCLKPCPPTNTFGQCGYGVKSLSLTKLSRIKI